MQLNGNRCNCFCNVSLLAAESMYSRDKEGILKVTYRANGNGRCIVIEQATNLPETPFLTDCQSSNMHSQIR